MSPLPTPSPLCTHAPLHHSGARPLSAPFRRFSAGCVAWPGSQAVGMHTLHSLRTEAMPFLMQSAHLGTHCACTLSWCVVPLVTCCCGGRPMTPGSGPSPRASPMEARCASRAFEFRSGDSYASPAKYASWLALPPSPVLSSAACTSATSLRCPTQVCRQLHAAPVCWAIHAGEHRTVTWPSLLPQPCACKCRPLFPRVLASLKQTLAPNRV